MTKWGLEFDSPLSTRETVALINVPWEVHHGHDWVMHEPPQATRNLDELHRISNNPGQHLSHFFFFFQVYNYTKSNSSTFDFSFPVSAQLFPLQKFLPHTCAP